MVPCVLAGASAARDGRSRAPMDGLVASPGKASHTGTARLSENGPGLLFIASPGRAPHTGTAQLSEFDSGMLVGNQEFNDKNPVIVRSIS